MRTLTNETSTIIDEKHCKRSPFTAKGLSVGGGGGGGGGGLLENNRFPPK